MSQSNSTTIGVDNHELRYYEALEKHIYAMSKKFRDKSVISSVLRERFFSRIFPFPFPREWEFPFALREWERR